MWSVQKGGGSVKRGIPFPPPPPTLTHTLLKCGPGHVPRCPPSRTPLNYSVSVNEQYLIPLMNKVSEIEITVRLAFHNAPSLPCIRQSLIASSKCVYVNTYNIYNYFIYTRTWSRSTWKYPFLENFSIFWQETLTDQEQKILQDQDQF